MSAQAKSYPLPLVDSAIAALVPCTHGAGCPLGVDAPAIANAIEAGELERAYRIARGPNPFASSCGHGCHAPCESACRRRYAGSPVAIARLEAYATAASVPALLESADPCTSAHDVRSVAGLVGRRPGGGRGRRSARRVAIVGGGVTGLACAHDLALLGHDCVIFDAAREPGGLLTAALPAFRFPVESTRAECAAILELGVRYQGRTRIDRRDGLRALQRDGFHAVFIATGASRARRPLIEHQPRHAAIVDAMDVLTFTARPSGRVVVVGEGDLALDAARVLARSEPDAATPRSVVHLVLAAELEHVSMSLPMLAAAVREGVVVHHGWLPRRALTARGGGGMSGIEIAREGGEVTKMIACDWIVAAAPRAAAEGTLSDELAHNASGFIATDSLTLRTSLPGVWAGGACAFGHRSIAHAVADGKRAAWQIHGALTGVRVTVRISSAWAEVDGRDERRTQRSLETTRAMPPRAPRPQAGSPEASGADAERAEMARQASRCLDCTVVPWVGEACTECGACVEACPVGAFTLAAEAEGTRRLQLDQEPCNRCGVCVPSCPEGAISMVRAVWEERLVSERITRSRRQAV